MIPERYVPVAMMPVSRELLEVSDRQWDEFVVAAREHTIKQMLGSALVATIAPRGTSWDDFDVKLALEVGASILLEKPLVVIAMPGRVVPRGLAKAADVVVHANIDTEHGREHVARVLEETLADLGVAGEER